MDQRTSAVPTSMSDHCAEIHQEGSHFESTHVTGGIALQGNFVGVTINSTAARQLDYTDRFSHSLLQPVKDFVSRPHLRDRIRAQLQNRDDSSTVVIVVSGPGGFGKTQLMLDYVREYRTYYKASFWLEAGRAESLQRDFVNLWQVLSGTTSIPRAQIDIHSAIVGVKNWFSGRDGPWLMVFDGADSIDNESAQGYIDIKQFIPDAALLHVVITTRSSVAKDMTPLGGIEVGEMSEAESLDLFYNYSQLDRSNQDVKTEIKAIVKEIGYLALAIALAGTYVGKTLRLRSDIKKYLPEYRQRRRELLGRKAEKLIHGYGESVLTTWEASYAAATEQKKEAAALMSLLSFLSYDDIWPELFSNDTDGCSASSNSSSWQTTVFGAKTADAYAIEECFEILQRYSLVQWKDDQQSYVMHKLVHAWGYERLSAVKRQEFGVAALSLVVAVIVRCADEAKAKLRLIPHAMAIFEIVSAAKSGHDDSTIDDIERIGSFVADMGRWTEAYGISEWIAERRRLLLGEDHKYTMMALNDLSVILAEQGQLNAAVTMQKRVLERNKRIRGENHPETVIAMHNLTLMLGEHGHLDAMATAKMQKDLIESCKQIFGEDDRRTIAAMDTFGVTLSKQGKLKAGLEMQVEALGKWKRLLGENHPRTIMSMTNLAYTHRAQGQTEAAAAMQVEAMEKSTQIQGEDHPETIKAMNNLACILGDQGKIKAAAAMRAEVMEKSRRILGEDHPVTIVTMNNLAITRHEQDQIVAAAAMEVEVVEKRKRILGEDHPETIAAMNNLACTLGYQGQIDATAAMNNLACTLGYQGQIDAVAAMRAEVMEKSRRILGEDHPNTCIAMFNLARTHANQGQYEEAIALLRLAVPKYRRIRGDFHPETREFINYLDRLLDERAKIGNEMFSY